MSLNRLFARAITLVQASVLLACATHVPPEKYGGAVDFAWLNSKDESNWSLADPLEFSDLGPADAVQVTFDSQGCFHHFRVEYSFVGPVPITVEVYDFLNPRKQKQRIWLGRDVLDSDVVSRLDEALRLYRSDTPADCTTSNEVTLIWTRSGAIVGEERLIDHSCGLGRNKRALGFLGIARRLIPRHDT